MISDTMNGRMNNKITRCCATFGTDLRTKTAMGNPKTKQIATAISEYFIESRKLVRRAEKKKFS